jgi:molecular chaperone DnaK
MPCVHKYVEDHVAKKIERGVDPMECVAMGAAIQAGVLSGEVKDIVLLDVTPLSLGIETLGGVLTTLIERNTTIPTNKSQTFTTAEDSQPSVEIHILQGERKMAEGNTTLGRFHLDGIPPAPRGIPQIEVSFDIDANGIINVKAKDLGTNKEQKVTITASTKLKQEDIDRMVQEAEGFAEEDAKTKEKVEIKNKADSLIYQAEKTVSDIADKMDTTQKERVNSAIEELRNTAKGEDPREIESKMDALTGMLHELSSTLYQQAQQPTAGGQQKEPPTAEPSTKEEPKKKGSGDEDIIDADYKVKE